MNKLIGTTKTSVFIYNYFSGTYVTFDYLTEMKLQTEAVPTTIQESATSETKPEQSNYIEISELERACASKGSNKSLSKASLGTSGSDVRTLEFDYVTVSNLKKEEKYSSLLTLNSEPKQWSETYDTIVR